MKSLVHPICEIKNYLNISTPTGKTDAEAANDYI